MDLRTLAALPLSAERGWQRLLQRRPVRGSLLLELVLPCALLPPAVLYLALSSQQGDWAVGTARSLMLASAVLLAELFSVAVAGRLLRWVAGSQGLALAVDDAHLLATLAPLPLWLSTAGVALPGLAPAFGAVLLGLLLSCSSVFLGIVAACKPKEALSAAGIVHVLAGAGLAAWGILAALLVWAC